MKTLIMYTKPGCHLCEGLQEKLEPLPLQLDVRDITQNEAWFQKYQYEVPVLCRLVDPSSDDASGNAAANSPVEQPLPRISPRASADRVAQMIQTHLGPFEA